MTTADTTAGQHQEPHLSPADGVCNCLCERCTLPDDLVVNDAPCICPDCNVLACGDFHAQPS